MSADNTILVLHTLGEYRVEHVQCEECLTLEPDYPSDNPVLNKEYVLQWFGDTTHLFYDWHSAMAYAEKLECDVGYVEYGIVYREFGNIPFPV